MIWIYLQKLKIPFMLLTLTLISFTVLCFYQKENNSEVVLLRQTLAAMNAHSLEMQAMERLVRTNQQAFDHFEACNFDRPITEEDLKQKFPYQMDFTTTSFPENMREEKAKVVSQEVTFIVPCLKDSDVFALVDQLLKTGPGIFQIREITIQRVSSLSEEMLQKIALGKPQALFDGKVKATWVHQ